MEPTHLISRPNSIDETRLWSWYPGCDLLFCLLNAYNISHEQVMNSIERIGNYVIPEFSE